MRRMPLNATELEKISYIEDFYDFSTEQLQHASKEPKYAKLIKLMKTAPKNYSASVLINDLTNQTLYTGTYNETDIQIYAVTPNSIEYIDINYDKSTDDMEINDTVEPLLTEDNIKTIFGQDITGTGDITLYRHQIKLTIDEYIILLNVASNNNLNVDSLQDLTTLLKPTADTKYNTIEMQTGNGYILYYTGTIWKAQHGSTDINVSVVEDIVTPM